MKKKINFKISIFLLLGLFLIIVLLRFFSNQSREVIKNNSPASLEREKIYENKIDGNVYIVTEIDEYLNTQPNPSEQILPSGEILRRLELTEPGVGKD